MKGFTFALLCVLLLALGTVAAACGDDNGDGAPEIVDETDAPEESEDAEGDVQAEDTAEPGDLPTEFGRGPEEAFVLAREACAMWEDWQPDGSESELEPIVAKAAEARAASTEVRDPVLEGLDRELSGLLDRLKSGEGSNVIELSNRLIGEVCGQVG